MFALTSITLDDRSRQVYTLALTAAPLRVAIPGDGAWGALAVAMNWCWSYFTFQRGTRLITGMSGSRIEDVMQVVMPAPPMAAGLESYDDGRVSSPAVSASPG